LDGTQQMATWNTAEGQVESLHEDLAATESTLARIREMKIHQGYHVALAHDSSWMLTGEDPVLMSLLDEDLKDFARTRLKSEGFP
jgi:hypothetical protein